MSGLLTFNGGSVNDSESHIAGERAARRGYHDLAGGSAAWNNGGHVSVVYDSEGGCRNAIEGYASGPGQSLAEDLCGLARPTRGDDECNER